MPNKRVRDDWEDAVKQLAADNPKWTAGAIYAELARGSAKGADQDLPLEELKRRLPISERTVARILEEWRSANTPQAERDRYERFHWPDVMQRGVLPWEASPIVLEFAADFYRRTGKRPHTRVVSWFYRVTIAAPSLDFKGRKNMAIALAVSEAADQLTPTGAADREWFLAFRPWEGESKERLYQEAMQTAAAKKDASGPLAGRSLSNLLTPQAGRLLGLYATGDLRIGEWAEQWSQETISKLRAQEPTIYLYLSAIGADWAEHWLQETVSGSAGREHGKTEG